MKKKILFMLVLLLTTYANSQTIDDLCATSDGNNNNPPLYHSCSTDPAVIANSDPLVLNVFFWQVKGPNGDYGNAIFTEEKLLESIANLNIYYNQFNIFFKYRGFDSFDTPADLPVVNNVWDEVLEQYVCVPDPGAIDPNGYGFIDRCQIDEFFTYTFNNNYWHSDAINIFVPYGSGFGGAARELGSRFAILKINKLNQPTAIHEIGHCLGLGHTQSETEHTTRDPNDPFNTFNACVAGDRILDTAANSGFLFFVNGTPTYPFINQTDCTYFGTETDDQGFPYIISHEDVINVMGNAYTCVENYMTVGQAIYMRETIENDSHLIPTITDIPSLYEPYKGEYYVSGPDLPDREDPLFQPGFDFSFIACSCENIIQDCNTPLDYNNISFQNNHTVISSFDKDADIDYTTMTHPNHTALLIDQLDTQQPRRCYDNWNKAAAGGSVTKFNDNVFNTNVTITSQDSTAINNQNLIQDLPSGLYKIEKNYNDGTSQEVVIFKENN